MATENAVLMKMARESLKGKWLNVVLAFFIYSTLISFIVITPTLTPIFFVVLGGALNLGLNIFILSISRDEDAEITQIFLGFNYLKTASIAFALVTFISLVFTLFFVVPGIIVDIYLSMTFYILADDPTIGPLEAMKKSRDMMEGNKMKFFYLWLSFSGWLVVGILTLGIGFIYIIPYYRVTVAKFYDDIKANRLAIENSEE